MYPGGDFNFCHQHRASPLRLTLRARSAARSRLAQTNKKIKKSHLVWIRTIIHIKIVWIGTKTTLCTNSNYTICINVVWIHLYEFVQKIAKKFVSRLGFQPGTNIALAIVLCRPSTTPPPLSVAILLYTVQFRKPFEKRDCTISLSGERILAMVKIRKSWEAVEEKKT